VNTLNTADAPAGTVAGTPDLRVRDLDPRFRDLCRMEWIKVRSLRSTWAVLVVATAVTIFINLNGVHSDLHWIDYARSHPRPAMPDGQPAPPFFYDPLWQSLSTISVQFIMLGAAAIGALTMFGEFSTGQIRTTFAAVPRREGVVMAKVAVLTTLTTVLAFAVAMTSFLGGQAILAGRHLGIGLDDPNARRAIAGYTLVVPVAALIGMLFGALIRNATASIVAVVAFLFLLPAFFSGDRYRWIREIGKLFPHSAEQRLTWWDKGPGNLGKWPQSVHGAWVVLAAWIVVSVVATLLIIRRRDV
jgi:ABC-type transport system involved in multi-copper enzyme maturation permease subunit